jgi:hypothetical protein|tara:strand:+ start:162 stop:347 length:186 start_codon:yes stop_codon:yes gene_type:complete
MKIDKIETCDDHWHKNSPCPYKHNKDGTIKTYKSIHTNWIECPVMKAGYSQESTGGSNEER